jgi:hypothetical protein
VLIDGPLNPERTQTLGAIIGTQLGSLTDLKTCGAAAAQARGPEAARAGSSDLALVTDTLVHLGVLATYGDERLLVAEC